MRKVDKPWGYEVWIAHTHKYVGKVLFIRRGHRLSLQYHKHKDETLYLFKGLAEVTINDITMILNEGNSVRIEPLEKHRIVALQDTYLFEVSTPEVDDVVRLEDDYGRA